MILTIHEAANGEAGPNCPAGSDLTAAVYALLAAQRQLAELIAGLSDDQYQQRPVGEVTSSVGSHVRHCLDHLAALVTGVRTGRLDYDDRRRGTQIERSRPAALGEIRAQERQLLDLAALPSDRPLRLTTLVACDAPPIDVLTSLGREMAFVLSHTIHHGALIAVMAKTLRTHVPERFGYAPSTLANLDQRRCVL